MRMLSFSGWGIGGDNLMFIRTRILILNSKKAESVEGQIPLLPTIPRRGTGALLLQGMPLASALLLSLAGYAEPTSSGGSNPGDINWIPNSSYSIVSVRRATS